MREDEFYRLIDELGHDEVSLRDGYDAVFHLVTAADGADEFYTTSNNVARRETAEEAIALDKRTVAAWTGHPHFRVIDNSTGFEQKMKRLIAEISAFLGEPEPLEIERKFLIELPDLAWLESDPACKKVEIIQTYLKSSDNEEVRLRQRGVNGSFIYFKTTKKKISDIKRIETEERISKEEYLSLMLEADTTKRQIRKTRYCLICNSRYFELDVYPFWNDRAILEVELCNENESLCLPEGLRVIREVTDDPHYKNAALAISVPDAE